MDTSPDTIAGAAAIEGLFALIADLARTQAIDADTAIRAGQAVLKEIDESSLVDTAKQQMRSAIVGRFGVTVGPHLGVSQFSL